MAVWVSTGESGTTVQALNLSNLRKLESKEYLHLILVELKKLNLQLEVVTDESILEEEI